MAVKRTISIDAQDAGQMYELFRMCKSADRHFHSCQSPQFRQFVSATYKAENVTAAFERLKAKLDEVSKVSEEKEEQEC